MTTTDDTVAYETRMTSRGLARQEYGPAFLYLIGGIMLAMSGLLLWPGNRK